MIKQLHAVTILMITLFPTTVLAEIQQYRVTGSVTNVTNLGFDPGNISIGDIYTAYLTYDTEAAPVPNETGGYQSAQQLSVTIDVAGKGAIVSSGNLIGVANDDTSAGSPYDGVVIVYDQLEQTYLNTAQASNIIRFALLDNSASALNDSSLPATLTLQPFDTHWIVYEGLHDITENPDGSTTINSGYFIQFNIDTLQLEPPVTGEKVPLLPPWAMVLLASGLFVTSVKTVFTRVAG